MSIKVGGGQFVESSVDDHSEPMANRIQFSLKDVLIAFTFAAIYCSLLVWAVTDPWEERTLKVAAQFIVTFTPPIVIGRLLRDPWVGLFCAIFCVAAMGAYLGWTAPRRE